MLGYWGREVKIGRMYRISIWVSRVLNVGWKARDRGLRMEFRLVGSVSSVELAGLKPDLQSEYTVLLITPQWAQ